MEGSEDDDSEGQGQQEEGVEKEDGKGSKE